MRLIGYIRVSTSEQSRGWGLDMQEEAIRKYCQQYNVGLANIFSDVESGTVEDRVGLEQALKEVRHCDGLLVYHTDRISRRLRHLLYIIETLAKQGKRIISTSQPDFDFSNPEGLLTLSIMGAVAEFELSRITTRMTDGRRMAKQRAQGTDINYGKRPRYDEKKSWEAQPDGTVAKRLVRDDSAVETIALIKRHRRSGKSYYQLAQYLNENGIPNKSGRAWNPMTIKSLCSRKDLFRKME